MREIVEAIFYLLRAGCPWRLLPDSFPPWRTVYQWFCTLRDDGVFESLNHHLVRIDRIRTGREPAPSAAVIDSQSVKTDRKSTRLNSVTNAQLVCRLLLEKKKNNSTHNELTK